jgi:aminopeptidase YwaD
MSSRLREHLFSIAEGIGTRPVGSDGNSRARRYVVERLTEMGLDVHSDPFLVDISMPQSGSVWIPGKPHRYDCWPCLGTRPLEDALLPAVLLGERDVDEYRSAVTPGSVVLAKRGGSHETVKARTAADAGAKAILFYVDFNDCLYSARVSANMAPIPAAVVRQSFVRGLFDSSGSPPACVVRIEAAMIRANCANLWADAGSLADGYVLVGAHFDSRPFTRGANDNAAGVALVLELARRVLAARSHAGYRFVFFDGEEVGVRGSRHFVSSVGVAGLKLMVNVDGLGYGRPKILIKDREGTLSNRIADAAQAVAAEHGLALEIAESRTGLSDHAPFRDAGVNCLWISDHPNTGRETDADNVASIDFQHLERCVDFYADLIRR